ncbi:MAG: hypothetical protein ACR2FO_01575 [Actinomycetota bacterium]
MIVERATQIEVGAGDLLQLVQVPVTFGAKFHTLLREDLGQSGPMFYLIVI